MRKLFVRLPEQGVIAGVCAGLAHSFGWKVKGVRIVTAIAAVLLFPVVPIAYVAAAIFMPVAGRSQSLGSKWLEQARNASELPPPPPVPRGYTGDSGERFHALEHRLREIEAYMTSSRYEIDRELKRSR
jgi:phage shock protein C